MDFREFLVRPDVQDVRRADRDGPRRQVVSPEAQMRQARGFFGCVGREHERIQDRETHFQNVRRMILFLSVFRLINFIFLFGFVSSFEMMRGR